MTTTLLFNGVACSAQTLAISPLGEGFMMGAGVFSTLRVRDGQPEFVALHEARLRRDVVAVGGKPIELGEPLLERCRRCVAANAQAVDALKIVWFLQADGSTAEIIVPRGLSYTPEQLQAGLRLMTVRCERRSERVLARHKTLNYLEHLQARRRAVASGFDEALWVDEDGHVLEGATSNVLVVKAGEVLTPPVKLGILPGVIRQRLLEGSEGFAVREAVITRADLAAAQKVFVTNSLIGVARVAAIDGVGKG